jgi:hypothetical protein
MDLVVEVVEVYLHNTSVSNSVVSDVRFLLLAKAVRLVRFGTYSMVVRFENMQNRAVSNCSNYWAHWP